VLEAYLTRKAGMYMDVAEQLVTNHLKKDDLMSALITGEWCVCCCSCPGYIREWCAAAAKIWVLGKWCGAAATSWM